MCRIREHGIHAKHACVPGLPGGATEAQQTRQLTCGPFTSSAATHLAVRPFLPPWASSHFYPTASKFILQGETGREPWRVPLLVMCHLQTNQIQKRRQIRGLLCDMGACAGPSACRVHRQAWGSWGHRLPCSSKQTGVLVVTRAVRFTPQVTVVSCSYCSKGSIAFTHFMVKKAAAVM